MKSELSHKERIERMLDGREIDRPPISAWRHFYHLENSGADLAASMIAFQRKFDWDFMKINPRASYHIEDWGAVYGKSGDPLVKPEMISFPIAKAGDWSKIKRLDPARGSLGEILSATNAIIKQIGSEIHVVQSVFSPLSIAGDLVNGGDPHFVELFHEGPSELHEALEYITQTYTEFVRELMRTGISGIFFATTEWASRDLLTEDEYLEFGRPYDLRVLDSAKGAVFNILHVCNKNNMLPLFRDYSPPVLSWSPFEKGNLSLHQAAQISDKIFLTGMDHTSTLLAGPEELIQTQIRDALFDAPPGRLIIGPACAMKARTPDNHLRAAIKEVKGWDGK